MFELNAKHEAIYQNAAYLCLAQIEHYQHTAASNSNRTQCTCNAHSGHLRSIKLNTADTHILQSP